VRNFGKVGEPSDIQGNLTHIQRTSDVLECVERRIYEKVYRDIEEPSHDNLHLAYGGCLLSGTLD